MAARSSGRRWAAWVLSWALATCAAEPSPWVAARLPPGVTPDIRRLLDDPAWQASTPVSDAFVEVRPVNGRRPGWHTSVQLLVDGQALYVGVRAEDPAPELIRASLGPHDSVADDQDAIVLLLDAVGSRRAAQLFAVNAVGVTADGMYTAAMETEDMAPDFDFTAHAAIDAHGYSAVFRLPFASLRFAAAGQGHWRLLVRRFVPRDMLYLLASAPLPADAHDLLVHLPLVAGVEPPQDSGFLTLLPSLTVSGARTRSPGVAVEQERSVQPSLDLKWRARADTVVDATLRPDFSQVDLDVPQLRGNTRFALYFDEKRRFFQESSDLWQMPTPQLYTRSLSRPDWGLRLTRRDESFAGTGLVARDAGGGQVLIPGTWGTGSAEQPASEVAALRWRADSDSGHAAVVGLHRRYAAGAGDNDVWGGDFAVQADGAGLKLRGQWLTSRTTAWPNAQGELARAEAREGHNYFLQLRQRAERVESAVTVEGLDGNYRNDTGFVAQSGVRRVAAESNLVWRNLGELNEFWLFVTGESLRARGSDQLVHSSLRPGVSITHDNGTEAAVELRAFERIRVQPDGEAHRPRYLHLDVNSRWPGWVREVGATLDIGRLADVVLDRTGPARRAVLNAKTVPWSAFKFNAQLAYQDSASDGHLDYRETELSCVATLTLAPGQDLRLIGQQTRLLRTDGSADERGHVWSLAFRSAQDRQRAVYVGVTRQAAADLGTAPGGPVRSTEVYVKWVHGYEW